MSITKKQKKKEYYEKNKERIKEEVRKYKLANNYNEVYYEKNKVRLRKIHQDYYKENKVRLNEYSRLYSKSYFSRPKIKEKMKEYYRRKRIEKMTKVIK